MLGETVGSYRIVGELGSGGMGAVYVGLHPLLGSRVAVKVLLPDVSRKEHVVERFFNEARAAAGIKHSGIVDIYDYGHAPDGSAYIVMELLEGESLKERIAALGSMPKEETLRLGRQIASALAAAHGAGVIHRDLKPDNVFVVPDTEITGGARAKVLDFGIAKLAREDEKDGDLTGTGSVLGTPRYMAPEQCRGAGLVDERTDVYAFGCVLYSMVCGEPPFEGSSAAEIAAKHMYEEPIPPRQLTPGADEALEAFILQCLAKDPEERPASMGAVLERLERLERLSGELPVPGRRGGRSLLTLALGAALVVSSVAFLSGGGRDGGAAASQPERAPADPRSQHAPPTPPPEKRVAEPEPEPETVTFEILSEPEATVYGRDRDRLGETPLTLEVEKDGEARRYVLAREGFQDARVELSADRDRRERIDLERKRRVRRKRRKPAPEKDRADEAPISDYGETADPFRD